ncbi:glycosyltransferase [Umezawaea endophytica]|uniref:Glycosyltransferase n=1 Tax=Umezawaea endophytica TaxID=1654476 RepID=A0A9X3AG13_9PSEU|nr:glycosyltransferase [Umezawaea endophytica]MCS7477900.1 glycosyltransferase [Umezawaea endophytica]
MQLLDVDVSVSRSAVVVTVAGEVDMTTAAHLAERLGHARTLVRDPCDLVVDLGGVRFLAAAGVAALLTAHLECAVRGATMWVVAPHRAARRPLVIGDEGSVLRVLAEAPEITAVKLADELAGRTAKAEAAGVRMAGAPVNGRVRPPLAVVSRIADRKAVTPPVRRSSLAVDLVAAAWETESAEYRAHIADLAGALHRQGHRVALHIRRTSADSARSSSTFEVVRVAAGPPTALSKAQLLPHLDEFAAALDQRWGEHTPDVVHLHSWQSGLAVRESAAPLAQSFHGLEPGGGPGTSNLAELERTIVLAADHLIAASGGEATALSRIGVPKARMSLVPWGVDTGVFSPEGPVAPRGVAPRVLALGAVAPHSGFDTVIEAISTVPDAELLVVGPIRSAVPREDTEMSRLVRLAREHGVEQRVKFTGEVRRASLPSLLRSADVAVCVPSREPSGIGALQAMACGVPVIATAAGALADIVLDDLTGVLVPPRDPATLGQALRDLIGDPVRRDICAITSVDRARARYSWDRVVTEVVDAYRKASGTPRDTPVAKLS